MSGKLIITKWNKKLITSYFYNEELIEISAIPNNKQSIIGNIYIGKVKNILKNIQAAFVDIGMDKNAYFSIQDNKKILFANKKLTPTLQIGDEIIVQVVKESTKTKGPVVTSKLNFTGRAIILTINKSLIGISKKIENINKRNELFKLIKPYITQNYGFIIRTNAMYMEQSYIIEELNQLVGKYERIIKYGSYRSCYQLLEKAPSNFITSIRDQYSNQLDTIIIDDNELMNEIQQFLDNYHLKDTISVQFYNDTNLSLFELYSLKTKIANALKSKVWLKSGGYIVIQPTEALVAIDVNTGKFTGKKKLKDTLLNINIEAAKEIAKQLRLRNLSGIIIVDFIDMKDEEDKMSLLTVFKNELKKDPIKTTVLGITSLNLVELTRKKIKKPIYEQFGSICFNCSGKGYIYNI